MRAGCTALDRRLQIQEIQGPLPQHPNNRPRQSTTVASAMRHKGPPILYMKVLTAILPLRGSATLHKNAARRGRTGQGDAARLPRACRIRNRT